MKILIQMMKMLITKMKFIKNNQACLDRKNAYEDYVKRRYVVLMENENDEYMGLSKRLEKSARVYRLIKKEFNRNYKVTE